MRRHGERIRVVIAKPGLDGHDKGAKIVARLLRDAGMEVIYTGLHRSIDDIVNIAIQEDVDVIGLSVLSGAHLPLSKRLLQRLETEKMLKKTGVAGVFPVATPFEDIVAFIQENVQ